MCLPHDIFQGRTRFAAVVCVVGCNRNTVQQIAVSHPVERRNGTARQSVLGDKVSVLIQVLSVANSREVASQCLTAAQYGSFYDQQPVTHVCVT